MAIKKEHVEKLDNEFLKGFFPSGTELPNEITIGEFWDILERSVKEEIALLVGLAMYHMYFEGVQEGYAGCLSDHAFAGDEIDG